MKTIRTTFIILFFLSFLYVLVACIRTIPNGDSNADYFTVLLSTPVDVEITEQGNPSITPIQTFIKPEVLPSIIIATPTHEVFLTPTPQPTPTVQIPLPKLIGKPSNYELTTPSLLELIKLQLSRTSQFLYSNSEIDKLLYPSFHTVLDYEWERSYKDLRDAGSLIDAIPFFYDHSRGRLTFTMLKDIVGDFVVEIMNSETISLINQAYFSVDEFRGYPIEVELDGDNMPEWLLQIDNPNGFYLGEDRFWITVEQVDDGNYIRLVNDMPWEYGHQLTVNYPMVIKDLTGDGLTDIVLLDELPSSSGQDLRIYFSAGSSVGYKLKSSIQHIETLIPGEQILIEANWLTSDMNDLPFFRVTIKREHASWNCEILEVLEFQWADDKDHIITYPIVFPNSPECAILKSVIDLNSGNRNGAIQTLQNVIGVDTRLTFENQVFVLYRLALLHRLNGEDNISNEYLEKISELSSRENIPIAAALTRAIESYQESNSLNPYTLCLSAKAIEVSDEIFLSPSNPSLKAFPYNGYLDGYPIPLCDSRQWLTDILFWAVKTSDPNPTDDLDLSTIPYLYAINLFESKSSEPLWIVVIPDYFPNNLESLTDQTDLLPNQMVNVLGYINNEWHIVSTFPFNNEIMIQKDDITNNGIVDLVFSYPSAQDSVMSCPLPDEKPYEILLLSPVYENLVIPIFDTVCMPSTKQIQELLVDSNSDGILDLITSHLNSELMDTTLFSEDFLDNEIQVSLLDDWVSTLYPLISQDWLITNLTNRTVSLEHGLNLINDIKYYQKMWDGNDPIDHHIQSQLTYLLALEAESNGDIDNAIANYYEVWRLYPDTIWAILASLKLDHKFPDS